MMFDAAKPGLLRQFNLAPAAEDRRAPTLSPGESVLFGLYTRIFVMQFTVILGAWFALLMGTAGAYTFLIAVKTAIDVAFQVAGDAIFAEWRKSKARAAADRQG
jgi:hypothetical protein